MKPTYSRRNFLKACGLATAALGVDKAICLAQQTECHVHIDHLNSTGGTFHMPEALKRIREARTGGLDMNR